MKIVRKQYDGGTISAPAFLDLWLENGDHWKFNGKEAKKLNGLYNQGDDFPVDDYS